MATARPARRAPRSADPAGPATPPPPPSGAGRAAAVFDLDRTLLAGGSGPVFAAALRRLGVSTPQIPGMAAMFRFFDLFGESYLVMRLARQASSRIRGLSRDDVLAAAEEAAEELLRRLQPFVPGVLEAHRNDGDLLVLATTSPHDLVTPFARRLGFDAVVATRYAATDGRYTGELDGPFVWGPGKLDAVRRWAEGERVDLAASSAYSDSVFDAPLLGAVGRPTAVNPDARLRALATVRRWPIRAFDAPHGVPSVNGVEPFDILRLFARPELLAFVDLEIAGLEHLPRTGPAIVAANHRSYFDPVALGLAVARGGRNPRFLGKKEVFDAPVVGQLATAFGGIRVDRGSGSDQPVRQAAAALRGGEVVVILPQGTIPRGEAFFEPQLVGRPGVARLAAMCPDVPVVPVGMWGTELVWPRSSKVPLVWNVGKRPKVTVRIGPPVEGLSRADDRESAIADTERVMAAIMDLLPPAALVRHAPTAEELAATVPDGDLSKVRTGGPRPDVAAAAPAAPSKTARTTKRASKPATGKAAVAAEPAPRKARTATKAAAKPASAKIATSATATKGAKGAKTTKSPKVANASKAPGSARAGSTRPDAPSRRLSGSLANR